MCFVSAIAGNMVWAETKNSSRLTSLSSLKKQGIRDGDSSGSTEDTTTPTVILNEGSNAMEHTDPEVISPFRVMALGLFLLTIGAVGFYYLPGMIADDASGSRFVNSIYCAAMTLTTIGFGDICPDSKLPPVSKLFIVMLVLIGLGFFCGPMLEMTSLWTTYIPGGWATAATITICVGVSLFSNLENIPNSGAIYASFIVGTTIGYGDYTPKTDVGKLAVAAYAIAVVNVVSGLLKPGRVYLEGFCRVPSLPNSAKPSLSSFTKAALTKKET